MDNIVPSITRESFSQWIASKPLIILRLYAKPWSNSFAPKVEQHFRADFPDQVAVGCFDTSQVLAFESWAPRFFGSFSDKGFGYYLFINGKCVAFHPIQANNPTARQVETVLELVSVFESDKARAASMAEGALHLVADSVVREFEPLVQQNLEQIRVTSARGATQALTDDSSSKSDPHEVLGVAKHATPEEIKRAYRQKMEQNHPDKVEHLGPAIKKVAQTETRRIQEAYEALAR